MTLHLKLRWWPAHVKLIGREGWDVTGRQSQTPRTSPWSSAAGNLFWRHGEIAPGAVQTFMEKGLQRKTSTIVWLSQPDNAMAMRDISELLYIHSASSLADASFGP